MTAARQLLLIKPNFCTANKIFAKLILNPVLFSKITDKCSSCESQENDSPCPNTVSSQAEFSSASRERTASVRRQHGELGVLIKIFYKSACAVHLRDNGLE